MGCIRIILVTCLCIWMFAGCRSIGRNREPKGPVPQYFAKRWEPAALDGLLIFRRNDVLYNSAQPKRHHFEFLGEQGFRAVINCRTTRDDRQVVESLGMKYFSIPMSAWGANEDQFVEFLRVAADPANQPVLVYCWYGGDRSNMLAAVYRVAVEGWSKQEAIRELTEGGTWFHPFWGGVVDVIRDMDVERIRRRAGLEESPVAAEKARGDG